MVCAEFDGHNAIRPRPGPGLDPVVESVKRSGLSHTSVSSWLSNHDPAYPTRNIWRVLFHSAPRLKSLVRESYGSATSTSLLNPKLAPHGSSPTCRCVMNDAVKSNDGLGVDTKLTCPLSRRSMRSNWAAIGRYTFSPPPFWACSCAVSSSWSGLGAGVKGVFVSTL